MEQRFHAKDVNLSGEGRARKELQVWPRVQLSMINRIVL